MATEIQLIHQIMESFEELKDSFELLNEKVELLQQHIEASNNAVLKKTAALESKVDLLENGYILLDDNGYVGYQHKVDMISRGIKFYRGALSVVPHVAKDELTIINTNKNIGD